MKILVRDQINRLAFVKKNDWSVNSFDIELIKVVGGNVYNYYNLSDVHSLNSCKDYIELDINLGGPQSIANLLFARASGNAFTEGYDCLVDSINDLGTGIGGGEYVLTLTNQSNNYIYLCLVKSYETSTGSGVYSNVVTFTDL